MASFNDYIQTNFPSAVIIKPGYGFEQLNGENFSRTEGGAPIVRRLYTTSRYDITLDVVGLQAADILTLRNKYNDDPGGIDSMTDPATGQAYSVVWIEAPQVQDIKGTFYTVRFRFDGVAQ